MLIPVSPFFQHHSDTEMKRTKKLIKSWWKCMHSFAFSLVECDVGQKKKSEMSEYNKDVYFAAHVTCGKLKLNCGEILQPELTSPSLEHLFFYFFLRWPTKLIIIRFYFPVFIFIRDELLKGQFVGYDTLNKLWQLGTFLVPFRNLSNHFTSCRLFISRNLWPRV